MKTHLNFGKLLSRTSYLLFIKTAHGYMSNYGCVQPSKQV